MKRYSRDHNHLGHRRCRSRGIDGTNAEEWPWWSTYEHEYYTGLGYVLKQYSIGKLFKEGTSLFGISSLASRISKSKIKNRIFVIYDIFEVKWRRSSNFLLHFQLPRRENGDLRDLRGLLLSGRASATVGRRQWNQTRCCWEGDVAHRRWMLVTQSLMPSLSPTSGWGLGLQYCI